MSRCTLSLTDWNIPLPSPNTPARQKPATTCTQYPPPPNQYVTHFTYRLTLGCSAENRDPFPYVDQPCLQTNLSNHFPIILHHQKHYMTFSTYTWTRPHTLEHISPFLSYLTWNQTHHLDPTYVLIYLPPNQAFFPSTYVSSSKLCNCCIPRILVTN